MSEDINAAAPISAIQNYGKLPLSFEANDGQVNREVRFLSRGKGYTLFLTSNEIVLSFGHDPFAETKPILNKRSGWNSRKPYTAETIRLRSIGANPHPQITGLDRLPGKSNYFIGNDPQKWHTNIANYARVQIENIYPGIDIVYYGNQRQLEYDWIIAPGADPKAIRLAVESEVDLKIDAQGNLILDESGGLHLRKPVIYQQQAGVRTEIAGEYVLLGKQEVGLDVGPFDRALPLVIDPILTFSTYVGGSSMDFGEGIALDSSMNICVAGGTSSTNFPTSGPYQSNNGGQVDVFITKFNASGTAMIYSTYIGGTQWDYAFAITLDSSGNAYVAGYTESTNFPTANAFQSNYGGGDSDAFVLKLNASGTGLAYSTFLGGSGGIDYATGIAVGSSNTAYVVGATESTNFPTSNPYQASNSGSFDGFVANLNASGNGLAYSTYLGGSGDDLGYGIAVDFSGNAYVTGYTDSSNFPTASPYQASNGGSYDAFVTKLNASGSGLTYSTYLGGNDYDYGYGIALDASGSAYVTGETGSANFPTASPYQASHRGNYDAFVTKLNASGNGLTYSTYLGGSNYEYGWKIALDNSNNAYVVGVTQSSNFPLASPVQGSYGGGYDDAFVANLNASGNGLTYSTYLGGSGEDLGYGIAVDFSGNAYVTGETGSSNFPKANPYQSSYGGGDYDAFVAKIGASASTSSITVTTNPPGLTFMVDGVPYSTTMNFTWTVGSSHTIAVDTPQGTGGVRYSFASWSDAGAASHTITTPGTATTYTANFATLYLLTTSSSPASGGTVIATPESPSGYYVSGTMVQLTATPNANYLFSAWSGDLTGTVNPQSITMSAPQSVTASFTPLTGGSYMNLSMDDGGATAADTPGSSENVGVGYAVLDVNSGNAPFGTAVFSFQQSVEVNSEPRLGASEPTYQEVTVSEAGVAASPPTTSAKIFIEYRNNAPAVPARPEAGTVFINTGIAVVNYGSQEANITYTLRNMAGAELTVGNGTLAAGNHFAWFIDNLDEVAPNFLIPMDFPETMKYGSLEITSDQPLSVLALRGTLNQRGDFLMTTTPVADLTQAANSDPAYFPQFVDGGGYTTSLYLVNTTAETQAGTFEIMKDNGDPLVVTQDGGQTDSSFEYEIPVNGVYRFQTDGSPGNWEQGWVRLMPDQGKTTPVGSGVFGYNPSDMLLTESGIPTAEPTMHARVYVDLSGNYNTGLAIANINNSDISIELNAYQTDGITGAGTGQGPLLMNAHEHTAKFADQFISDLPAGFTGVLDISSASPFAALTVRSLINEREDYLITTFPIADAMQPAPAPIVFPQIADGGGYFTQFILISPAGEADTTLYFYGQNGDVWPIFD